MNTAKGVNTDLLTYHRSVEARTKSSVIIIIDWRSETSEVIVDGTGATY